MQYQQIHQHLSLNRLRYLSLLLRLYKLLYDLQNEKPTASLTESISIALVNLCGLIMAQIGVSVLLADEDC